MDINKEYKQNDATENGKEYWKTVKSIRKLFQVEILLPQIIPGGKLKFDKITQMYEPLIHFLLTNDEEDEHYVIELLDLLILKIYQHVKFNDQSLIKDKAQVNQAKDWCYWIVLERIRHHDEWKLDKIIEIIAKFPLDFSSDLLAKLQSQRKYIDKQTSSKITEKLQILESSAKEQTPEKESDNKRTIKFDDIDDITNDLENLKKRFKLAKQEGKPKIVPFQTYQNWEPKPFGVI